MDTTSPVSITITIHVHDEYADPSNSTGLTSDGFDTLIAAVARVGEVADGPDLA